MNEQKKTIPLSELAMLQESGEQAEEQLRQMLRFLTLDLQNGGSAIDRTPEAAPLRRDCPQPGLRQEAVSAMAPKVCDGYVSVPNVLGGGEK